MEGTIESSGWKRPLLPNVGFPWQQRTNNNSVASESEVLEVMKEANKARSTDHNHHHHHHHHRDDLRRMDEGDQGELEKQRLGTVAWDDLNQILPPASAFAAGYNPSNNISNSHKNTNHSRCSEAHGHSAIMSQELTRPASTATGRGSIQSGSQFSHLRRSDLPFALGHGHQQQDSVNSMQQFYYHHSNDYEDNEVEAYGYYRYSGNELREHQASRYSQDNYSNGYHEQQSDYSYRVHGYNQQQQGYKDSYMQLQSPSTTHYMYHQQTHQELNPQRLGRPLTLVRSHSTPGSVQLSETFRTSSTDLYQRNNNMSSNNNVNHATGGIIDCNSNRNNNGNDDNNTANSRVDDNGSVTTSNNYNSVHGRFINKTIAKLVGQNNYNYHNHSDSSASTWTISTTSLLSSSTSSYSSSSTSASTSSSSSSSPSCASTVIPHTPPPAFFHQSSFHPHSTPPTPPPPPFLCGISRIQTIDNSVLFTPTSTAATAALIAYPSLPVYTSAPTSYSSSSAASSSSSSHSPSTSTTTVPSLYTIEAQNKTKTLQQSLLRPGSAIESITTLQFKKGKGSKRMTKTTSRTNDLKVGTHNPATKRTKHIEIVVVEEEEEEEKDQEIPLPLSGHTTVTGTVMAAEAEVCVVRGGNTQYPSNEDRNNPGQGNDDECYETAGSRYQYLSVDWRATKDRILPTSRHARNALIATIIAALVTIALEALLVQRHRVMITQLTTRVSSPFEISFFRPLTVYYCIFILAQVFAVGLLWDAAIHKNSLQLVAFTIFEWCMVSYSGLQIWQHDQLVRDIGIPSEMLLAQGDPATRLILFSQLGLQIVATVGITLLTWRLYSEFGWLVFQKLGADMSLRKMMKEYRLLFTLLKLDAFFFFGYAIQIAVLTDKHWQKGMTEIAFAIPLSMIIMGLGFCALRKENKATMLGFIACLGLLVAYMIYRLIALYQPMTGDPDTDPYFFSRKTMTVFAALTLFMTILAFWNAIVMYMNFNKGLKEAMIQYRVRRSGTIRSVSTTASMSVRQSCTGGGGGGGGGDNSTQSHSHHPHHHHHHHPHHILQNMPPRNSTGVFSLSSDLNSPLSSTTFPQHHHHHHHHGVPHRHSKPSTPRHKSILKCDSAAASPRQPVVMVERWEIE